MIYIVSGFMRSGTSMMMQALMAGGMDAHYDEDRVKLIEQGEDEHYRMNPDNLYEPSRKDLNSFGFPRQFDGKLLKVLYGGIPMLAPHEYRVVFMRRDPREIQASLKAAFQKERRRVEQVDPLGLVYRRPKSFDPDEYDKWMDLTVEQAHNRKDMDLIELRYEDVVADPWTAFEGLGWPIDVSAAAAVVDPTQRRHRVVAA